MKKQIAVFLFFASCSLGAMDPKRKELPKEFLDQLPPKYQTRTGKCFEPFGALPHTPLSLYRSCRSHALIKDAACNIESLEGQIKSCGLLATMQRQIACWRLYRRSLNVATYGLPPEERRIPNHESEHSSYAWCRTPNDWYMQCRRECANQRKLCMQQKQSGSDCSPFKSLMCYVQCHRELQRNKYLIK